MVDEAARSVGELLSSQLQCSELMLFFHSAGRNSSGGSLIDGCNSPNSRYSSLTTAAVQFLINRADGTVSRILCVLSPEFLHERESLAVTVSSCLVATSCSLPC